VCYGTFQSYQEHGELGNKNVVRPLAPKSMIGEILIVEFQSFHKFFLKSWAQHLLKHEIKKPCLQKNLSQIFLKFFNSCFLKVNMKFISTWAMIGWIFLHKNFSIF